MTRGRILALVCAAALSSSACAGLLGSFDTTPDGLSRYDGGLRTLLVQGRPDSALALATPERSQAGDELLRLQIEGLLAHYAGEYERSNRALQASSDLAEDRYTRSISRALLSAVSSDRVLAYRPPRIERVLQSYYALLNRLEMGDISGAAVEARRIGYRLDLMEAAGRQGEWREVQATLRHLTGAVFELAGEANDAAVAYRIARSLRSAGEDRDVPATVDSASASEAAAHDREVPGEKEVEGPSGEVLVIVEEGFVAHRVERSANLLLWPDEIEKMKVRDQADEEDEAYTTSLTVAERVLGDGDARAGSTALAGGSRLRPRGRPHLVRVAWPVLAGGTRGGVAPVVIAEPTRTVAPEASSRRDGGPSEGGTRTPPADALETSEITWRADLSGALREEFEEDRTRIMATSILRAVAKYSLGKALEDAVSEEDETAGELVGLVADVGGALLERADTRSWNLLPDRLGLVRLRLPAGRPYDLELKRPGRTGTGARVSVGTVDLRPGELRILSVRIWDEHERGGSAEKESG